ncbi:MAG: hypothetical protein VKJ04_06050 [Vampirovibrionales bacterium]|nr:hypothetical protein [Vampirovibrionales bacterium]
MAWRWQQLTSCFSSNPQSPQKQEWPVLMQQNASTQSQKQGFLGKILSVASTETNAHSVLPVGLTSQTAINPAEQPIVLISKDDIYADEGKQILLLKQGMEVPSDLLPKLIGCGVDPARFELKDPIPAAEIPQIDLHSREALRSIRANALSKKHVLVLDTQQKSIQRSINALTQVGFTLGKIHPVRLSQYLGWALDKYEPSILVIDYELESRKIPPERSALDVLEELVGQTPDSLAQLEQIIMTVSVASASYIPDYEAFIQRVEALGIDVLFKPVLPKALEDIVHNGYNPDALGIHPSGDNHFTPAWENPSFEADALQAS